MLNVFASMFAAEKRQKHSKKRPHPDLRHKWNHQGDESYHKHNRLHTKINDNNQSQNKFKEHSTSTLNKIHDSMHHIPMEKSLNVQQSHQQQQQHESKSKTPKKVLTAFEKQAPSPHHHHHPVHIMDMNVSEMDSNMNDKDIQIDGSTPFYRNVHNIDKNIDEPTTAVKPSILTSTVMDIRQQPLSPTKFVQQKQHASSNIPIVHADVTNGLLENGVVLNDRVTSIAVIDRNENSRTSQIADNKNTTNNNNNHDSTVNPVILANDKQFGVASSSSSSGSAVAHLNSDSVMDKPNIQEYMDDSSSVADKGYYEKTIVNKNGVFIENIRKISGIDERILDAIDSNDNTKTTMHLKNVNNDKIISINDDNDDDIDDDVDHTMNEYRIPSKISTDDKRDEINRKSIDLMNNGPLVQHYVITSSGKIEKTDTMNSDEMPMVLSGNNGGQKQNYDNGNGNGNGNGNSNNNNNNDDNYDSEKIMNFINSFDQLKNTNHMYQPPRADGQTSLTASPTTTISSSSSSSTTTNNNNNGSGGTSASATGAVKTQSDNFPGGSFLTTINSALPASVTTSSLADQSNSNCIVMGKCF